MPHRISGGNGVYFRRTGVGVTVEVAVGGEIPAAFHHIRQRGQLTPKEKDIGRARKENAGAPTLEAAHAKQVVALAAVLLTLLLGGAMRDGDVPAELLVDFAHFGTEKETVGGGVALAAEQYM